MQIVIRASRSQSRPKMHEQKTKIRTHAHHRIDFCFLCSAPFKGATTTKAHWGVKKFVRGLLQYVFSLADVKGGQPLPALYFFIIPDYMPFLQLQEIHR